MRPQKHITEGYSAAAKEFACERLDGRLFEHTCECANSAAKLARRFGLDGEKTVAAAYLHDIAKTIPKVEQAGVAREMGMSQQEIQSYPPPVLHGPLGALIAERQLGIDDPEILQAIRAHSSGCKSMCDVAKAVFIADYIEISRKFPGADELRSQGNVTLNELTAAILESKLRHLLEERRVIDPRAFELWNELMVERK